MKRLIRDGLHDVEEVIAEEGLEQQQRQRREQLETELQLQLDRQLGT